MAPTTTSPLEAITTPSRIAHDIAAALSIVGTTAITLCETALAATSKKGIDGDVAAKKVDWYSATPPAAAYATWFAPFFIAAQAGTTTVFAALVAPNSLLAKAATLLASGFSMAFFIVQESPLAFRNSAVSNFTAGPNVDAPSMATSA